MAKEVFNYSKPGIGKHEFFGFHHKGKRIHIDTKRLSKTSLHKAFPKALFTKPRNTHYFIPRYKRSSEYKINLLMNCLNKLSSEWTNEYQYVISKLKTPKEVEDQTRTATISSTCDSEDFERANEEAIIAASKRIAAYNSVIKSIYLQYIQRIFIEYFRCLFQVVKTNEKYKNAFDFRFKDVLSVAQSNCNGASEEDNPVYHLEHYKYFKLLNLIDNFLKHNSIKSYQRLANENGEFYSNFVFSEKETGINCQTGTYAGNWLKIEKDFIPTMLDNLKLFSQEYCKLVLDEDYEEAIWNSDEALLKILNDALREEGSL